MVRFVLLYYDLRVDFGIGIWKIESMYAFDKIALKIGKIHLFWKSIEKNDGEKAVKLYSC